MKTKRFEIEHISPILITDGKIAIRQNELAHVLNMGPPHDRNRTWKFDGNTWWYLEQLYPDTLQELFYQGKGVLVVMDGDKPLIVDGKVILDLDNVCALY